MRERLLDWSLDKTHRIWFDHVWPGNSWSRAAKMDKTRQGIGWNYAGTCHERLQQLHFCLWANRERLCCKVCWTCSWIFSRGPSNVQILKENEENPPSNRFESLKNHHQTTLRNQIWIAPLRLRKLFVKANGEIPMCLAPGGKSYSVLGGKDDERGLLPRVVEGFLGFLGQNKQKKGKTQFSYANNCKYRFFPWGNPYLNPRSVEDIWWPMRHQ